MTDKKKTILVVEDEPDLREILVRKIQKEGFTAVEATNGKEGLTLAISQKPDLILLDMVMPIMDGMTMLNELRNDDWGKDANVIILTNLSDQEKLAESIKNGVHDYLVKTDWKLADLMNKIRQKIE